ncbi:TIGR03619 family F420-dependent LLM class oxidoreductase [Nocardioides terrisoli]|uniref:TIGR03619 family F420-dependent LLM class oxidoreductase n=1 Tax=Nocardioides terrisoli TaxID=3388267 RepID=UPI00287B7F3E|nr:TIGR03619 family F420-dependent LLM class oxidoreductase [Nocardioides marmorisolisilvae]
MKFGVSLFPLRAHQTVDVATACERLGYDSVWMGEHVVTPVHQDSHFPYAEDDAHQAFHGFLPFFDPYAALGFLAARTSTLELVVSISIVPLHDPFRLARSVMTMDQYSDGRFRFGIGSGWLREEFEIMGKPFNRRGRLLDETLDVMDLLFTERVTTYRGDLLEVPPVAMEPKPTTSPHPPYIFGGHGPKALIRAATRGQGWLATGMSPETVGEATAFIRGKRAELARDDAFEFSAHITGDVTDAMVEAYGAAGIDRLVVRPWAKGSEAVDRLEELAERLAIRPDA